MICCLHCSYRRLPRKRQSRVERRSEKELAWNSKYQRWRTRDRLYSPKYTCKSNMKNTIYQKRIYLIDVFCSVEHCFVDKLRFRYLIGFKTAIAGWAAIGKGVGVKLEMPALNDKRPFVLTCILWMKWKRLA